MDLDRLAPVGSLCQHGYYLQAFEYIKQYTDRESVILAFNLAIQSACLPLIKLMLNKFKLTLAELNARESELVVKALQTGSKEVVKKILDLGVTKADLTNCLDKCLVAVMPHQELGQMLIKRYQLEASNFQFIIILKGMAKSETCFPWLIDFFQPSLKATESQQILELATKYDNNDLFLHATRAFDFHLTSAEIKSLLAKALQRGSFEVAQAIVRYFGLIASDFNDQGEISQMLSYINIVPIAIWFLDVLEIAAPGKLLASCLKQAAQAKNGEMIHWCLHPKNKLSKADLPNLAEYLASFCQFDPNLLKQIHALDGFGLTKKEILTHNNDYDSLLRYCCQGGDIELITWLIKTFHISAEELKTQGDKYNLLAAAMAGDQLNICRWLAVKCELKGQSAWSRLIKYYPKVQLYVWTSGPLMFNWVKNHFELDSDQVNLFCQTCLKKVTKAKEYPLYRYLSH